MSNIEMKRIPQSVKLGERDLELSSVYEDMSPGDEFGLDKLQEITGVSGGDLASLYFLVRMYANLEINENNKVVYLGRCEPEDLVGVRPVGGDANATYTVSREVAAEHLEWEVVREFKKEV